MSLHHKDVWGFSAVSPNKVSFLDLIRIQQTLDIYFILRKLTAEEKKNRDSWAARKWAIVILTI